MDERLLHAKLDKLLVTTADCKVRLEWFSQRLNDHTDQDAENFSALRQSILGMSQDVDSIRTKVEVMAVKHDLVEQIGRKSGRASAAKIAPVVTAIVIGIWEAAKGYFGV